MILQCSQCNSRYLVPDQAIGTAGRNVRCANCAYTWFQQLPPALPEEKETLGELDDMLNAINARAEADIAVKPLAPGANVPVVRRKVSLVLKAALAVTGVAAAAMLALLVYPALLGFPASKGLVIADPGAVRLVIDNHVVYTINGKVLNTTGSPRKAPAIRVTLMNEEGTAMHTPWNIRLADDTIPPGKAVAFTTGSMELPPDSKATRFAVDIGNPIELALRRKPQ
jgi:predicted Zn finger-like uncharacterized protein